MAILDRFFPAEPSCARYLPAVSADYAEIAVDPYFKVSGFAGLDLDYLNPRRRFHYPLTLLSAGQSAKTASRALRPTMVSRRDPNTFVVADSGGFQIQEGTMSYQGLDTVDRLMKWMAKDADWMMSLDFPTGGITSGNIEPHRRRLESEGDDIRGLCAANNLEPDYNAARLLTQRSTAYMVLNREMSRAKLLVVLQGRSEAESRDWYLAMRPFITEGIAFAGGNVRSLSMMLNRLLDLKEDNKLKSLKLVHVLGVSTLQSAIILTAIQQALSKHEGLDIQFTYDSSSPFTVAYKYYQAHFCYFFDRDETPIRSAKPIEWVETMADATLNEWSSELCRLLNMQRHGAGRVPVYSARSTIGDQIKLKDLVKRRGGKLENDADAFHLVARHNVEVHTLAHQQALQMFLVHQQDGVPVRDIFQAGPISNIVSIVDLTFHQYETRRSIFQSLRKHEFSMKFSTVDRRRYIAECRAILDIDV